MIKVIVESPFAGNVDKNLRYLRAALHDCLKRGEAPFASHAIYTQPGVLDDNVPTERQLGIKAGFVWGVSADKVVVYTDLGTTRGMQLGIDRAKSLGQPVEFRALGGPWSQRIGKRWPDKGDAIEVRLKSGTWRRAVVESVEHDTEGKQTGFYVTCPCGLDHLNEDEPGTNWRWP